MVVLIIAIVLIYYSIYKKENNIEIVEDDLPYEILKKEELENKERNKEENFPKEENEKENKDEDKNDTERRKVGIMVVHVQGEVKKPGIVEIEENSRVIDAIEKAGGLTEKANLRNINLAEKVIDGTKIYIPNDLEEERNIEENIENKKKDENKEIKVNINNATQTELESIPGIGPTTARKIIEYRKENGKFKSIEGLKEISGIGENKLKNMAKYIEI